MPKPVHPALLAIQPRMQEVSDRWEAYWNKAILDRPLINIRTRKPGYTDKPDTGYYDRMHKDFDALIAESLEDAESFDYVGDSFPTMNLSFGPDELAAFCGGELVFDKDSMGTNWSEPFVQNWEDSLPIAVKDTSPWWQRMQKFYQRAAEVLQGRLLLGNLDYHSNMDLLLAMRGGANLCMDLIDCPEMIDRAMPDTWEVFRKVFQTIVPLGRMNEVGHCSGGFTNEGTNLTLQCDFSCMIGKDMFRRWVMPALEYEASLVDRIWYHWDGPGAIKHFDDLMTIEKIHTFAYVPNPGEHHIEYLDMYKRVQALGKSVYVDGTADELKIMHRELKPELTHYYPRVSTRQEAEDIIQWFKMNT